MKKIGKKIGKYSIIVFLLLLGLACVGVLYLFFVPNSNLFGITYISHSSNHQSTKYETADVSKIIMTSNSYDVSISTTSSSKAYVNVHDNSLGFVLTKNNKVVINSSNKDGVIEFSISEPYGLAVDNSSKIELVIPESYSADLELKNNRASTTISSEKLSVNDLIYSSKNGDATLKNAKINGDLILNLGNSIFTVNETASSSDTDVKIDVTTGKFDGSAATFKDVTVNSNERGIILVKKCKNFVQEVKTAGGSIDIKEAYHALIKTSDTNVTIGEITNNVIVNLSASGSIKIDNLSGHSYSDIKTADGNININKANSSLLVLETDYGNATINKIYNIVEVITNHGTVNVNFAEDAKSYTESNSHRTLDAHIRGNGKVTATEVENINITIEDNGRADINMNNVYGTNKIEGKNGSVNIKIEKEAKYQLKTTTKSGAVRVNLTQIPEFDGYKDINHDPVYVNCLQDSDEANSNKLTIITESGSITVLDTNF